MVDIPVSGRQIERGDYGGLQVTIPWERLRFPPRFKESVRIPIGSSYCTGAPLDGRHGSEMLDRNFRWVNQAQAAVTTGVAGGIELSDAFPTLHQYFCGANQAVFRTCHAETAT